MFNYIKRIKHNLYAVCNIEFKSVIADQYMIASKIKANSYISYHSAFDYYGVKNQMLVYVSSKLIQKNLKKYMLLQEIYNDVYTLSKYELFEDKEIINRIKELTEKFGKETEIFETTF